MSPLDRPALHAIENALAMLVFLIVAILMTDGLLSYPSWPTVGGVPVNPELVVPGLLGLVALLSAGGDGWRIGSIVTGVLGSLTFFVAALSLHTLYTGTAGGVFFGGLLTLACGTSLALVVLARSVIRTFARRGGRAEVDSAR